MNAAEIKHLASNPDELWTTCRSTDRIETVLREIEEIDKYDDEGVTDQVIVDLIVLLIGEFLESTDGPILLETLQEVDPCGELLGLVVARAETTIAKPRRPLELAG
jgi:hypothetical protein